MYFDAKSELPLPLEDTIILWNYEGVNDLGDDTLVESPM